MRHFRSRGNTCIAFALCTGLVVFALGWHRGQADASSLAATALDWPVYHRDNLHSGYVADIPDPQHLTVEWNTRLDGAVYAEPLAVAGHIIAATENNTIYSLDPQSGRIEWQSHIAAPVPLSKLPCGNINPLGITGTPAYDAATGLLFAVAETTGPAHQLVAVDLRSGEVRMRRPAEPPKDAFALDRWALDNRHDEDLGSLGPVILPGGFIFIAGKSAIGYLLQADALNGLGGQIAQKPFCHAFGGAAVAGDAAFVPCNEGVQQVRLASGPNFMLGWRANETSGSPVIGGKTVYSLDRRGVLYALDIATGKVRLKVQVGETSRFATPTLYQNRILVGTMKGIVAVTAS